MFRCCGCYVRGLCSILLPHSFVELVHHLWVNWIFKPTITFSLRESRQKAFVTCAPPFRQQLYRFADMGWFSEWYPSLQIKCIAYLSCTLEARFYKPHGRQHCLCAWLTDYLICNNSQPASPSLKPNVQPYAIISGVPCCVCAGCGHHVHMTNFTRVSHPS